MKAKGTSWSRYIWNGTGRRLSLLGEWAGIDTLVYNPIVMLGFHHDGLHNAPKLANAMLAAFPKAERYLDVGCGTGMLSAELHRRGLVASGCERSLIGRMIAQRHGAECFDFDLTREPASEVSGPFDVVSCFEVAEHLPAQLGDKLVHFVAGFQCPVVWSAAYPGQGGTGHINEQPAEYWLRRFAALGYELHSEATTHLSEAVDRSGASPWLAINIRALVPK